MSKRYAVKSGNRQHIQNTKDAIANREAFQTSGALSGRWDGDSYEVLSYNAVIGYWTSQGGWVVNTRRYSVTTSMHQGVLRNSISGPVRYEEWS